MPGGKRIGYYRGDSASYQAGLFNQLEEDGVKYGITVDQDKAVKSVIALIPSGDWREPVEGCGYELGETVHCMNETKKAFRLVVKRWVMRQGELFEEEGSYGYHAVATNWLRQEKNTEEVLKWHNQRGAKNFDIGAQGLWVWDGADALWAELCQCRLFQDRGIGLQSFHLDLSGFACPESWMKQTIATFRWKMVQVAGRIVKHAGETVLKLMIDLEKLELFKGIRRKSFELSLCPDG